MWWLLGLVVMFLGGVVAGGMVVFTRRGPVLVHASVQENQVTNVVHYATERIIVPVPVTPGGPSRHAFLAGGGPLQLEALPERQPRQLEQVPAARIVADWTRR